MTSSAQAIRTARLFESYVKNVWPLHRRFVRRKFARRCKKCAASEAMIPLGDHGICRTCADTQSKDPGRRSTAKDRQDLDSILGEGVGRGSGHYDALVLFSGGKDSSYLIRRVQTEHPDLRLLALTIDNGFMSAAAKDNVDRLLPLLGMDHLFVRPKREFFVKLFRYALTHLGPEGGYGTVDFSDGEFMLDTARRMAAEQQIPLILCGYSRYQVQNGLQLHAPESPRDKEASDRTHVAGLRLADIFSPEEVALWWHGSQWPQERIARLLFPLFAWDLEESEIKNKAKQWGLLGDKEQSPIVTNHRLIPVLGVVDVHKLGYSSFEVEFCRMIREGKADRNHWQHVFEFLEYCARTGMFVEQTVVDSLAELHLTPEQVGVRFSR